MNSSLYSITTKISLNRKQCLNNYSLTIYRINSLVTSLDNIVLIKTFNLTNEHDQLPENNLGDFTELDEIRYICFLLTY